MYLNKVYLIGNLTRDPELRSLPNGNKVTQFSLATNRVYKNDAGQNVEMTEYHNIVVFGRQAETSAQYLKKGQNVLVEGRIQTRSWDDKNTNEKKYRTEIVADSVQFGAKAGGNGGASYASNSATPAAGAASTTATTNNTDAGLDTIDYGEELDPNDIPF